MPEQGNQRLTNQEIVKGVRNNIVACLIVRGAYEVFRYRFDLPDMGSLGILLMTATTMIAGKIIDIQSTLETLQLMEEATRLGIDHGGHETNSITYGVPTEKEVLGNRKLFSDSSMIVCGLIFPPLGVLLGYGSFTAATNNVDVSRQIRSKINRSVSGN